MTAGPTTTLYCRLCGDAFSRNDHLALHAGRLHPQQMTLLEQNDFADALAGEEAQLGRIRVHVTAGLAVVPIFLFFMFTIIGMVQLSGNVGFIILLLPGFGAFSALVYFMVVSRAEYNRIEAQKASAAASEEATPPKKIG